jgi:cytochrome c553
MINKIVYFSCFISVFLSHQAIAAGNPEAGAQKTQTCSVCHGPNGNSINPIWPKLAGQHPQYTVKQLQDFKSGARTNPQMSPMATGLFDQDIEDIAAYFSEQPISESPIPASVEYRNVELGERIYRGGNVAKNLASCMACHGPGAKGNPAAMYPSLAGQHAAYTAAQLQAFKTETRNNDTNAVMRDIALKLTNEEIQAVSQYIQGLY